MATYSSRNLPFLDTEPRTLGIAPPPYRSCHDDDSTSGRYSDSSFSSITGLKRRSSWTNFVEADENLNKFKVNVYPKVSSKSSTASVHSNMANPLPNKYPLVNPLPAGSLTGSNMSVSQSYYGGLGQQNVNYHARPGSHSANNSMHSEFFVMPKGSYQKLNYASPMPPGATPIPLDNPTEFSSKKEKKSDKMESIRTFFRKPIGRIVCGSICFLIVVGIILAIVLPLTLILPNHYTFSWQAPEMIRNRQTGSNHIQLDIENDQARFNLRGAVPFHSNFISFYDFKSNKVAIIDSALQSSGKTLICFVMDLNRQQLKDLGTLKKAANNAKNKQNQTLGWQEAWNYVPSPITNFQAASVFKPDIQECRNARWVELSFVNSNQKPTRCSDCYDFCLPDYGVERDVIRNQEYLNIVKRNCFYMFVPEWKNFAQGYPQQPGQQQVQQGYQITQTTGQQPYGINQPNTMNMNTMGGISGIAGTSGGGGGAGGGSLGGYATSPINQQQYGPNQQQQYPGQVYGPNQQTQQQGLLPSQLLNQQQQQQQQQPGYGNNLRPNTQVEETRWINVANVPQQIANRTSDLFNQGQQQVSQWGQQLGQNLGILPNNNNNNNNNNHNMNNNQNPLNYQNNYNSNNPNGYNPNDRGIDRNGNGVYGQHNLNGFDYQQNPLNLQPPAGQTANINSMLNNNQGMGPTYNVHGSNNNPDSRSTDMSSSSVSGSGLSSLVHSSDSNTGTYIIRNHRGNVYTHDGGYSNPNSGSGRGQYLFFDSVSNPNYHFIRTRDTNTYSPNFHTEYLYKPNPPNHSPSNVHYVNNQPVKLTPPGWNGSFQNVKDTRLSTSYFANPNLPSPFPPLTKDPQSPHDRPLFPSQIFNKPTVEQENKRLRKPDVILGMPSQYFNQQHRTQQMQQQLQQETQHLNPLAKMQLAHSQQSVGLDLSATIPPGQSNVDRNLQFLQNFGK